MQVQAEREQLLTMLEKLLDALDNGTSLDVAETVGAAEDLLSQIRNSAPQS